MSRFWVAAVDFTTDLRQIYGESHQCSLVWIRNRLAVDFLDVPVNSKWHFCHMTDYLLCKHKHRAMEDNTENDNDFHDIKSDRRLTGRTSVVGYVIKNVREEDK
jgi:hypothetical protein